jgi:hypothetical protein
MKKFLAEWRDKGRIMYLVIFLGMIVPATLSYYAAEAGNFPLMALLLGLVVLANLFTLI